MQAEASQTAYDIQTEGLNLWYGSFQALIDVNASIAPEDRRIPFQNMIYIADGPSDVPSFSITKKGDEYTIQVTVENQGIIPTALKQAQLVKIVRPDTVSLVFPEGMMSLPGGGGRGGRGNGWGTNCCGSRFH